MSGLIVFMIISAFLVGVGALVFASSKNDGWLLTGIVMMIICGTCWFVSFMNSFSLVYKTTCEYITPNTITKTSDGITVASFRQVNTKAITSDKADIYLTDNTNLVIMIEHKMNHWNKEIETTHAITVRDK